MEIVLQRYWPIAYDHASVKLSGDLTWIADFDCKSYTPLAVFHAANPDRDKGHQDYCCLFMKNGTVYVTGRSIEEVEAFATRAALHCPDCDRVIYSMYRHNMQHCGCHNACFIDGGSDYARYSTGKNGNAVIGIVNLLTKTFKPNANPIVDDK